MTTTLTHTLLDNTGTARVGVVATLSVYDGNRYADPANARWSAPATSGAGGSLSWTIPDGINFNRRGTYFTVTGPGIAPAPVVLIKPGTTSATVAGTLVGSADVKGKLPNRADAPDVVTQPEIGVKGLSVQNGTGAKTAFTIAHGLGAAPTHVAVTPGSAAAAGPFYATADATNLTVTYLTAPTTGTGNVTLNWRVTP